MTPSSLQFFTIVAAYRLALSSSFSSLRGAQRKFRYIPYGSPAPDEHDELRITCDGRVFGATLELTHWTGNDTPERLYADTSTEMALQFARQWTDYVEFEKATVLNNHYDTDGVLSVWACIKPEEALKYEKLLIEGAEAGDFGEWSSDEGVKLDCAILSAFCSTDEEESYELVLNEMSQLMKDVVETKGASYENLRRAGFDDALSGWNDLEQGRAKLRQASDRVVVLEE